MKNTEEKTLASNEKSSELEQHIKQKIELGWKEIRKYITQAPALPVNQIPEGLKEICKMVGEFCSKK